SIFDLQIFIEVIVDFADMPKMIAPYTFNLNLRLPHAIQEQMIEQEIKRLAQRANSVMVSASVRNESTCSESLTSQEAVDAERHASARQTTFINGIDVARQLEEYVAHGHFTSTTKFVTADVKDLYTMIQRQGAIEALIRFLEKYSHHGKIGTLTINHILRMVRLILDTNCFAYSNTYYRQIRGGAVTSAFTQVLANISMLEWEQDLIQHQTEHGEIYGRYIDDIFMTTNHTVDEINCELARAQKKDINI
ncbi:unnamed protein product, partial [Didymodactylos carnosus]